MRKIFASLILVLLLFSQFYLSIDVEATEIFVDGFESGNFSAWTGTSGSPTVVSSDKHHGAYSCKIDTLEGPYKDLGRGYNELYVRVYFKMTSYPNASYYRLGIIRIGQSGTYWGYALFAEAYQTGGITYFSLHNGYTGTRQNTNVVVQLNQWYCVEVKFSTSSNCILYIDGVQKASVGYYPLQANRIAVGLGSALAYQGAGYIDCVVVADTYIGLEADQHQVSLSSEQDNGQTKNIGKIKVGTKQYALPNTETLGEGQHTIQYISDFGYEFKQWITTGNVNVVNSTANPTTLIVSGTGTLKVVYRIATPKLYKITINSQQHEDYGLGYPVTYVFQIPSGSSNLKAYHRHTQTQSWSQLPEKTSNDFFNGIECVRFDYSNNKAYVSVSFDENYDDIYIKITDADDNLILFRFLEIAEYYDNRKAVVTATADDWGGYIDSDPHWVAACNTFRSFNVWLTVGVITRGSAGGKPDWKLIQSHVNSGYIEIASHSATHPTVPYDDYDQEIGGSKQDIINNLNLPTPYKKGNKEYVWAWLEPFDMWDDTTRQKLGQYKYLIDRTSQMAAGYDEYVTWDVTNGVFNRIGIVGYADTFTLQELNVAFDDCYNRGKIYHLFFHAIAHDWSQNGKVPQHLNYISGRKDIWYVGFGALYAYRYVSKVANVSVEEYELDIYTLTVNVIGAGSVSRNPDKAYYYYGENVTLMAIPEIGWSFSHWSGDLTGSINPQFITIDGNKVVTATFTQNQYTLNVNIVGSGSVSKNPDQETYTYGTSVTLTANPSSGWSFIGWSGDATGSANPVTIMIDGNKDITATFAQNVYTLSITVAGSGTVIKNPDQAAYTYGTQVELIAVPSIGWSFDHWNGDLTGSANPTTILIDTNKTITATFTRNTYSLTIDIIGSGSVYRVPDKNFYYYGEVVTLTATPSVGWVFSGWGGNLSGSANPVELTITGNMTVVATFTQNIYTLAVSTIGNGNVILNNTGPYHHGDVVELTAVPAIGWSFAGWGGDLSGVANPTTIVMTSNKTIIATFTIDQYTLTINIVGSGSVSKVPDQATYTHGSTVELTAEPKVGWHFVGWSGDATGIDNPITITMDGNKNITATFAKNTYTLTISIVGSGSVNINNTGPYYYGDIVELMAVPKIGWSFYHWSGDLSGSVNPTTIAIDGNKTVTATFTQNTYTLTITIVGEGSVYLNNSGPYHYGDVVELTAVPAAGWVFSIWSGDLTGSANPTVLTITGNMAVTATFTQNTYVIVASVEGGVGGTITPNGTILVAEGQDITFTITPAPGYRILNVNVDGTYLGPQASFTFYDVQENHTITAIFAKNEYTLTIIIIGGGKVTVNPNKVSYSYGDVVTLTAIPNKNWVFSGWSGDITSTTNPLTITIDRNITIIATFTRKK